MKMKSLNIILVLLFSVILSSCVLSFGDESVEKGCQTFDEIFSVSKLSDVNTQGLDKGSRIQICDVPDPTNLTGPKKCQGISAWIYTKVTEVLKNSVKNLWNSISEDSDFRGFISGCIVLVIMFYGLAVMFGMVQVTGYSALMIFMKIAFVWLFATNYEIFNKYVINTFEAIVQDLTKAASNIFIKQSNADTADTQFYGVLEQIDLMISYVWDPKVMKVIMALFTAGTTGFFWGLTLFCLTIMYLMGVLNAVKIFIISLIGRYVLYALGPIFLTFALFNQTRSLFESWVEQLTSFTLQPIFLFIFLGIFHVLLAGVIINLNSASTSLVSETATAVCWKDQKDSGGGESVQKLEVVNCKIGNIALCKVNVDNPMLHIPCKCKMKSETEAEFAPEVKGIAGKIDLSFVAMLTAIIISYMLMPMANWVVTLAASLSGGMVSAASATIPGMNKVEGEISKGVSKAIKGLSSGDGDGKANR